MNYNLKSDLKIVSKYKYGLKFTIECTGDWIYRKRSSVRISECKESSIRIKIGLKGRFHTKDIFIESEIITEYKTLVVRKAFKMGSNNTIRVKISRKPDPKTDPKTKPQTIKGSKSDDKESERKSEALDKWSQRIARIQLKMNLPAECGPKADDMLRKYLKNMKMTGRPIKAIAIACVYIAAKQVEMPHTLKEMAFINKVSVKQIGRYAQKVAEALRIDADPITPDQLISRYCYRLGLERAVERQAFHIANASYKLHVSSGPSVVAAAAIYMASRDSNDCSQWRSVEDVKGVACISTATIRNTCALLKNIR